MTMDIETCCQWRVTDGQLWNPTSREKRARCGAPVIRYGPGREKFRLKLDPLQPLTYRLGAQPRGDSDSFSFSARRIAAAIASR